MDTFSRGRRVYRSKAIACKQVSTQSQNTEIYHWLTDVMAGAGRQSILRSLSVITELLPWLAILTIRSTETGRE
jgi:hypothetical protein